MESTSEIKIPASSSSERSQLLTVLCVLSFIMACIMIILSALKLMDSESGLGNYVSLVLEAASLFGIILMWQLKKVGFFIYSAAELIPWILIFSFGDLSKISGSLSFFPAWISGFFYFILTAMIIIDVVFIFLYLKTLKEMK